MVKEQRLGLDWWPQGGRRGEAGEMFRRLAGLDLKIDLFSGRARGPGMRVFWCVPGMAGWLVMLLAEVGGTWWGQA